MSKAKTLEGLRKLQAVILPLEYGLTLEQTAQATGVSVGWISQLRNRFIQEDGRFDDERPKRGGRYRQNMNREEEERFLAPFLEKASKGGILVVSEIKEALDRRLGRKVALSSAYNLLHRPYSPELNPVEHIGDDLREKYFHNRVFDSMDSLENHLEEALRNLENNPNRVHSIVAWPWIINAL